MCFCSPVLRATTDFIILFLWWGGGQSVAVSLVDVKVETDSRDITELYIVAYNKHQVWVEIKLNISLVAGKHSSP